MDGYLKLDGIEGECRDAEHRGWIDINNFSWKGVQEARMDRAGNVAPGVPSVGPITFSKVFCRASPTMFSACATGRHFETAEFHAVVPQGKKRLVLMKVRLEGCLITKLTARSAEEGVAEDVEMVYQTIFTEVAENSTQVGTRAPV